ncbi:(2Fe-2S)-binding protein [Variovorax rhizosphaerae]|uniref:(2Fe-2S)-binding protein n=1 Tax=Variovorax rhizosphaerae TaxID=1836200 RepID=A0ABU8WNB2_9BURK
MKPVPSVVLQVNGQQVEVVAGSSVAAALRIADAFSLGVTRRAIGGELRAPFCGMGICQECRVTIDGARRLACQTVCVAGMQVETWT